MRDEAEIARTFNLLTRALQATGEGLVRDRDMRMILIASHDLLAWVLEYPKGAIFQSVIEVREAIERVQDSQRNSKGA